MRMLIFIQDTRQRRKDILNGTYVEVKDIDYKKDEDGQYIINYYDSLDNTGNIIAKKV